MGLSRQLVDTIKGHFALKSTAELQEITRLKDLDRWSEEAFVAATEVLADRAAGRAKAPRVPVKDTPPPSVGETLTKLLPVLGFTVGGLVGGLIGDLIANSNAETANKPGPFGSNAAWFAVETTDTAVVAAALGLQQLREATWEEGVAAAYKSAVFVTPPLGDWTLAVSTALMPPEGIETFVKPLLEQLSRRFREVQYFCTHRNVELHVWARAQQGRLLRGYGWLGQQSRTLWNEGPQTRMERDLGFQFTDGPVEPGRAEGPTAPDESCVLRLASFWSVDPTSLDEHFHEPVAGLVGRLGRAD